MVYAHNIMQQYNICIEYIEYIEYIVYYYLRTEPFENMSK